MLILHLTSVQHGGAFDLTDNIHKIFCKYNFESYIQIKNKILVCPDGKIERVSSIVSFKIILNKVRRFVCKQIIRFAKIDNKYAYYNSCERFTCYSASSILSSLPRKPDIIMIHWVSGFINARLIKDLSEMTKSKIYILMIDNSPLTGGCHYPWNCKGYQNTCRNCPISNSLYVGNRNRKNLYFKRKNLPKDVQLITFSISDYVRAKQSLLFHNRRIHHVIAGVDETKYSKLNENDRAKLKESWNIPAQTKIIMVGASFLSETRKGFFLLDKIISAIKYKSFRLLIVGNVENIQFSCKYIYLGHINTQSLINAYHLADVFISLSLEDSGPMMVNQALMTGTPVVAFNIGVARDIVSSQTGYLSQTNNYKDFAMGIDHILFMKDAEYIKLSNNCRSLAMNKFSNINFETSLINLTKC